MFIKQVYIKNFWKKGNIVWDLKEDVNVLVGINGSGKSTILNLINEALQPTISDEAKKKYFSLISEITIHLSDDTFVFVDSSGERFPPNIEKQSLELTKISTFDILNSLDDLIGGLQLQFEIYQKNLYKKFEESLKVPGTLPNGAIINQIFGRRKVFIEMINALFAETGKSFSEDTFSFKLSGQQYELSHKYLSSGEKQIFYILLQVLIQNGAPAILLLDEPEISLHIDWQRDLIRHIRQLNDKCQVIAVTHSSNMFYKGWVDYMKNMEDIKHFKLNGQLNIDLASKIKIFVGEFKILTKNREKNERLMNDVNTMLHRAFFMLTLAECKMILQSISNEGLIPDHFTYTTLISKTTNKADAMDLLNEMKKKKIQPNAVTYVNVLKKTENYDEAISVFDLMRKDRIEPAIQHFSTLLGKADTPDAVERVEELRSLYGVPSNDIYANKLQIKK